MEDGTYKKIATVCATGDGPFWQIMKLNRIKYKKLKSFLFKLIFIEILNS